MARAGARDVRLEVDVRNTNAIRFYERMGFRDHPEAAGLLRRGTRGAADDEEVEGSGPCSRPGLAP